MLNYVQYYFLLVQVSFVVLVLKEGTANIGTLEIVTLAVGIPYTLLWDIFGWLMVRSYFILCLNINWIFCFCSQICGSPHETQEKRLHSDPTLI